MGAQDLKLTQRAETHEGVIFKQVPLRMCAQAQKGRDGVCSSHWLSCGRNCPGRLPSMRAMTPRPNRSMPCATCTATFWPEVCQSALII